MAKRKQHRQVESKVSDLDLSPNEQFEKYKSIKSIKEVKRSLGSIEYFSNKKLDAIFQKYLLLNMKVWDKFIEILFPKVSKRFPELTKDTLALQVYVDRMQDVLNDELYVDALSKYKLAIDEQNKVLLENKIAEIINDDIGIVKEIEDDEIRLHLIAKMEADKLDAVLAEQIKYSEVLSNFNLLPRGNTKENRKRKTDECLRRFAGLIHIRDSKNEYKKISDSELYSRILEDYYYKDEMSKQVRQRKLLSYSRLNTWKNNNRTEYESIINSLSDAEIKEFNALLKKLLYGTLS